MAMNTLGLLQRQEPGQPDAAGNRRSGEVPHLEEEGRPVPRPVGRFRRTGQPAGFGRNDHRRRLAAGRHGRQGAGRAVLLRTMKEGYRGWAIGVSPMIRHAEPATPSPPMPTTGCRARPASPCPNRATTRRRPTSRTPWRPKNTPSGTRASLGSAPKSAASRKAICATAARWKTRAANVAYWHQWPDEYDHLIQKWDEFLSTPDPKKRPDRGAVPRSTPRQNGFYGDDLRSATFPCRQGL
jgi:putative spermidine/putrescine transport system substrate-binding protein